MTRVLSMRPPVWLVIPATLLAIFLGANSVHAAEPFRIGAALSLTGGASFIGEPELKAVQLAVDEVNAAGGINGRRVELFVEDTKSTETAAVLGVRKLITQHKVSAIIGPSRTGDAMAVIPVVSEAGVVILPMVSGVAAAHPVKERKWVFRSGQGGDLSVMKVLGYAKRSGWTRLGVLYSGDAYGEDGRDNMRGLAPRYGIEIGREETFPLNTTDLKSQLTNMKDVDAVFMHGIGQPSVVVYKNARELGFKTPIISGHGQANSAFRNAAGKDVEGQPVVGAPVLVWSELPDRNLSKKPAAEFVKKYTAKHGQPPDQFSGSTWDGIQMVLQAFREVGDDRAKIRDWLETRVKNWAGVTGVYTFSELDHAGLKDDALVMMIAAPGGGWQLADYEK